LHFRIRVTSPIEGCHAILKAYLQVSTGDLKVVFDCLIPYGPTQHLAIQDIRAIEQGKVMHQLNKQYFDLVLYLVYNKALLLIINCMQSFTKRKKRPILSGVVNAIFGLL
jgi:hypothetical protein